MSRRQSPIDRRAPARISGTLRALLAFAAALALLTSQAVSALHFAFVPHHLCGIHGALEDGAAKASVAHEAGDRKASAATSGDAAADAHEACIVAALSKHAASVPPAVTVPVAITGEISSAVKASGVDVTPDRASLLARAPKLSPPRLG
jgi:hypothetical protein